MHGLKSIERCVKISTRFHIKLPHCPWHFLKWQETHCVANFGCRFFIFIRAIPLIQTKLNGRYLLWLTLLVLHRYLVLIYKVRKQTNICRQTQFFLRKLKAHNVYITMLNENLCIVSYLVLSSPWRHKTKKLNGLRLKLTIKPKLVKLIIAISK